MQFIDIIVLTFGMKTRPRITEVEKKSERVTTAVYILKYSLKS